MPLRPGLSWTYTVRTGYVTYVEPVRVERPISVAGAAGYALSGPLGESRLAWKQGTLYAERFVNVRFEPAMPILVAGEGSANRKWRGRLIGLGPGKEAEAALAQAPDRVRVGTQSFPAAKASLTVLDGSRRIEAISWYVDGIGLVRTEHRTDGKLDVQMDLLAGPK